MTYLDEAYRRMKLPITVLYDEEAELWGVISIDKNSPDHGHWWGDTKSAIGDYLDTVDELGGL
jgi:hypothetical protein